MSGDHYITQHIGCYYLTSYCLKFSHIYLVKIFCTLLALSKTPIFFPYLQNTKHFDRSVSPTVWRSSQCHLPLWFDSFIGIQRNVWLSVLLHTLWNISCIDWVMIVLFTWYNWWTRWIRHRTLFYQWREVSNCLYRKISNVFTYRLTSSGSIQAAWYGLEKLYIGTIFISTNVQNKNLVHV